MQCAFLYTLYRRPRIVLGMPGIRDRRLADGHQEFFGTRCRRGARVRSEEASEVRSPFNL